MEKSARESAAMTSIIAKESRILASSVLAATMLISSLSKTLSIRDENFDQYADNYVELAERIDDLANEAELAARNATIAKYSSTKKLPHITNMTLDDVIIFAEQAKVAETLAKNILQEIENIEDLESLVQDTITKKENQMLFVMSTINPQINTLLHTSKLRTQKQMAINITPNTNDTFFPILDIMHHTKILTDVDTFILGFVSKSTYIQFHTLRSLQSTPIIKIAAMVGNIHLYKYFSFIANLKKSSYIAAAYGRVDILCDIQRLDKDAIEIEECNNSAANTGAQNVLDWIYNEYGFHKSLKSSVQIISASNGHREVFVWLKSKKILPCDHAYETAAKNGKGILLLHLLSMRRYLNIQKLNNLAELNHDFITVWLLDGII
jgi:hypothetical protein